MIVHKEPYAVTLLAFSPITILLNLSVIISFIATKQVTQNTSNILIFGLNLYDFTAGMLTMPLTANVLLSKRENCIKSKLIILLHGNGHSSFLLTVLLALDRYLHMNPDILNHPSRVKTILKVPNIYVVLAGIIITTNAVSAVVAFELYKQLTVSIATSVAGIFSILLVALVAMYIKGYLRIRKFADNNPVYSGPMGSTPDYVRKLYKTVLVIVSLAFIEHVPYCIAGIIISLHYNPVELSSNPAFAYFFEFATLSTYAGCFTNCLAVLHFNTLAMNWILNKTGMKWITQQCRGI